MAKLMFLAPGGACLETTVPDRGLLYGRQSTEIGLSVWQLASGYAVPFYVVVNTLIDMRKC